MSLYENLFDWQKNIVDKFKDRKSFGLFLEQGLGKTIVSLAFAEQNNCSKTIVITLKTKVLEDETERGSWFYWGKQSSMDYKLYGPGNYEPQNNSELLVVNYEDLFVIGRKSTQRVELKQKYVDFIKSCKGKNVAVIVDESHKIKTTNSKRTLAIKKLKKGLDFVANNVYLYLLTGTPFTKDYIDLYSQLSMLGCTFTKTEFIDKFCIRGNIPGLLGWQQPIVGYKNLNELFDLVHKVAITIKSKEIINLPEQIFVDHVSKPSFDFNMFTYERVSESMIAKYEHKNVTSDKKVNNPYYRNIDYPNTKYLCETSGQFWLRARQLSIGFQGNAEECDWYDRTRLNQLEEFLSINEDNYVLFYNYTPELIELYNICEKLDYNIDVYCGEIKSLTYYEQFVNQTKEQQLTNKKNIILANFASGSTGKNWQAYDKCILFSLPIYINYEQGIKRLHRIGQNNTVFYHLFYQDNWLDKSMKDALSKAINYSEKLFESELSKNNYT